MTLTAEEQERALHYLQAVVDLAKHVIQQDTPATEEAARDNLRGYLNLHFPEAQQLADLQRAALMLGGMAQNTAQIIGMVAQERIDQLAGGLN